MRTLREQIVETLVSNSRMTTGRSGGELPGLMRQDVDRFADAIETMLRSRRVGLADILAACQQLDDDETRVLQTALAWDVEDVETAEELMQARNDDDRPTTLRAAIWKAIGGWQVCKPGDAGFHGATGTDAEVIARVVVRSFLSPQVTTERPKSLFAAGDDVEVLEGNNFSLSPGLEGTVYDRKFCLGCGVWHYGIDFGEFTKRLNEPELRTVVKGEDNGRPPTGEEAPAEQEDGLSGKIQVRIDPDGYPWVGVFGLIGLLENLGCAAYRDEEVAEPGPEPEAVEEYDVADDAPLWKVEASRAFDHLLNAARLRLRV